MPKRKLYTVEQKLEAVARVRRGESQAKVSRDFFDCLSKTSIRDSVLSRTKGYGPRRPCTSGVALYHSSESNVSGVKLCC